MSKHLHIDAPGIRLAATLHGDDDANAASVVLLNSAMGMPRGFYRPFAEFLAAQGMPTLTWDYRGIGDSLTGDVAKTSASIHDWGERDLPAVIDWLRARYPRSRLIIVAHSVGGQILGMTPKTNLADRLVLIGSQSGYWRLWTGRQQLRIGFMWHVVIPLASRVLRAFPSRWFGFDVNLPNDVAREWARWGRDPDYLMGRHRRPSAVHYAAIDRPLLNVWISDDDIATHAANRRMLTWYSAAPITCWDITPSDLGVDRIGHYRLFRETVGPLFWPRLVAWMEKANNQEER